MTEDSTPKVRILTIEPRDAGQRIDNFLFKNLKGVPKSRIYRALRTGEIRVDGARIRASYRLQHGDPVRLPPMRQAKPGDSPQIPNHIAERIPVLFEDQFMLVVDKPAGLAVHGGSGMEYGLIEALRVSGEQSEYRELVHRLDRETSGCLMLAKDRETLKGLQQQFGQESKMEKQYLALVAGKWDPKIRSVSLPLARERQPGKHKRMVVDATGQRALSEVRIEHEYGQATLLRITLRTGRMHQARVHCASQDHPVAGDRLYGYQEFNREMRGLGLRRMFLHASVLKLHHPASGKRMSVSSPLPDALDSVLKLL